MSKEKTKECDVELARPYYVFTTTSIASFDNYFLE